ncbi:MAG: CPBP family intramembrane metalloprotease, partial [Flavobacterium sp.]
PRRLQLAFLHRFGILGGSVYYQIVVSSISFAIVIYTFFYFKIPNRYQFGASSKLSYLLIPFYLFIIALLDLITIKLAKSIFNLFFQDASTWNSGLEITNEVASISIPITFVLFAIFGPIKEELLFRGIVFGEVRKKLGFMSTLIYSTTIFTVIHMSFYSWNSIRAQLILGLPPVFISGLILGMVRARHSLVHSIILHILVNAVAFWNQFK